MKKEDQSIRKTTIGGQALIEGILMRGPNKTAIVVRKEDGTFAEKIEERGTASVPRLWKWPVLRGMRGFFDSMKYGVSAITYSASFFEESAAEPGRFETWLNRKLGKKKVDSAMTALAVAIGVALPVGLFILLPTLIAGLFPGDTPHMVKSLLEGGARIAIFLLFIMLTSLQKDVRRTYMYHGAEHKAIHCYERELPLTVDNVRGQSRCHPRCGTSFLFVVMIVSILFFSLFTWSNPLVRVALRLALLPVVVGLSYEINRYTGRHDNALTRALRAPGLFLQRFTTGEPDDGMIEVAIRALEPVIPEQQGEDRW